MMIKQETKDLFWKAVSIAASGYPISYVLNLTILPPMLTIVDLHANPVLNTVFIGIPYFFASVLRIFGFDYIYNKYNIHIDPAHYIKKVLKV